MSNHENELGHGHSVAAWSAVIVAIIGVTLLTLGYCIADNTMTMVGAAVTVVSIFLGPVLAKLGYGVAGKSTSSK